MRIQSFYSKPGRALLNGNSIPPPHSKSAPTHVSGLYRAFFLLSEWKFRSRV
ncbi:hypothetical protein LEP1GSC061_1234 [Leptospira wolffii serovar Khorat str. Khorat-H2]|nr:hypothetical protein LEP1GSC061_1234 [Leptospira wolffii serovar Khorat str. Khorat-H2]